MPWGKGARKYPANRREFEKKALEKKLQTIKELSISKSQTPVAITETRREEFTRYMERTSVLDAMVKVLYELHHEPMKPINPVQYFIEHLSNSQNIQMELDYLSSELFELEREYEYIKDENTDLRASMKDLGIDSDSEEEEYTYGDSYEGDE